MRKRIPVAEPALTGREREYVLECLDSSWISSNGVFIARFEEQFAKFVGVKHALSCSNGTTALHLALLALGVAPGDEVIVPTLTYVACANAVTYCGATPVFVDSEPYTWNLDPEQVERAITPRTKAVMIVHLYGHPADADPILEICRKRGVAVFEDAAEAHGARYKERRVGGLCECATFSFYGNKVITTGEGGMVTTNDDDLAARIRLLKGQGMDPNRRYWFPIVGYNYRLTNVAAAIGLAQLERVEWHLQRRRENAIAYAELLRSVPHCEMQGEQPWARSSNWMSSILLGSDAPLSRDSLMQRLESDGIETRPLFYPMHELPMYRAAAGNARFPQADRLSRSGINLPSSATLERAEIEFICSRIAHHLRST